MGYDLKIYKVLSTLPTQLEPNALYLVRVGDGFDFYVTTNTEPPIARKLNTEGGGSTTSNAWSFNLVFDGYTEIKTSFTRESSLQTLTKIDGVDIVEISINGAPFVPVDTLPIAIAKDVLVVFKVYYLSELNPSGIIKIEGTYVD